MRYSRRSRLTWPAVACGLLLVGAGAGRALTAAIPAWGTTSAGAGSAAVTPFTVSGVSYALDAFSPQNVDSVSFTLGPAAAATVRITFDGNAYSCSGTTAITCATTSPQAHASSAASGNLVVVAAQ